MQNQNKIHKAKKSLGQNFLKSTLALKKIIEAGEIAENDIILEIGPGKGVLTAKLLSAQSVSHNKADKEKIGYVVAIEKDRNLFEYLQIKFEKEIQEKKLKLLNEDILEFNASAYGLKPSAYKIIANIPYNITGAILKKFLTEKYQPELMVLMVQNEVAKRIVAQDKKESLLSISVKAYGTPKMIMKVPARYFSPAPKVDSAVISIKNISREFFTKNNLNEENFWEMVHAGFAHKRKKLSGNLKNLAFLKEKDLSELKNKRAEDLSLEDWVKLTQKAD